MKRLGSFWIFLAALVVVAVAVALVNPHAPSAASRVAHLETLVRCPSCEDLSVAQSTSTSSLAVRHEIARLVQSGASDSAILTRLESTYGASVLLSPPTSGIGVVLWLVPLLGLGALLGVALRLARRR